MNRRIAFKKRQAMLKRYEIKKENERKHKEKKP
jgi:hypothetical protein